MGTMSCDAHDWCKHEVLHTHTHMRNGGETTRRRHRCDMKWVAHTYEEWRERKKKKKKTQMRHEKKKKKTQQMKKKTQM